MDVLISERGTDGAGMVQDVPGLEDSSPREAHQLGRRVVEEMKLMMKMKRRAWILTPPLTYTLLPQVSMPARLSVEVSTSRIP